MNKDLKQKEKLNHGQLDLSHEKSRTTDNGLFKQRSFFVLKIAKIIGISDNIGL